MWPRWLMYDLFDSALFPLHLAFVFIFGSLWGSFIGLCVARIPAGQSIIHPGSYCFSCGKLLKWHDNIPLFSYWRLGGRCRFCGTTFSSRHFWIEFLSGALFAWAFFERCNPSLPEGVYRHPYTLTILSTWIFTGILLVSTFTDIDHWIIPDRVSLGGAAIGLALSFMPPFLYPLNEQHTVFAAGPFNWLFLGDIYWTAPANAAFGAAFGYGVMWLIGKFGSLLFRKEAMGGGDMKLFACVGAFLGWINCIYVLFLASILGVAAHLAMAGLFRRRTPKKASAVTMDAGEISAEGLAARAMATIYPDAEDTPQETLTADRNALLHLMSEPSAERGLRHHLPFGPYLAAAAFLVALYHEEIKDWIDRLMYGPGGGY